MVAGARAVARGWSEPHGLLTETPMFEGADLPALRGLVFGGHDIRRGCIFDAAREIYEQTGTIPYPMLRQLAPDLRKVTAELRRGTLLNAGRTITRLADRAPAAKSVRAEVRRLERDIRAFTKRHKLTQCVCVNLTSTEPQLRLGPAHRDLARLEEAIDRDAVRSVRPSLLYAYVAAKLGHPFIHFTPSNAALVPAVRQSFDDSGVPYMGSDGKTGETLVKSSLAPMFKYRNLRVLSWQGYNMLGDRDGVVLADADNKRAKVESKDALLAGILGYPLHTHVGIDYVPSLNDLKTAWDFIHFQGFLGVKMSMQFTWQGCDAILAAPIVLDLIRLAALAQRRGETGSLRHLSCFFKRPLDVDQHDLHQQWHLLADYAQRARQG